MKPFISSHHFLKARWAATIAVLFVLSLLPIACTSTQESPPTNIKNLTTYSADAKPEEEIELHKEQQFGSTGKVLIGTLGHIAVDTLGRVYIADNAQKIIRIFDAGGKYLGQIGRQGRGPAEFQALGSLTVRWGLLFVYDVLQLRISVFSLKTLNLSYSVNLNQITNRKEIKPLEGRFPSLSHIMDKDRYLIRFTSPVFSTSSSAARNLKNRYTLYYILNKKGAVVSGQILKQKAYRALTATVHGEYRSTLFGFLGKSLLALSEDNTMYTAQTKDFLVEVRDFSGAYQYAFYYPVKKHPFSRTGAIKQQERTYSKEVADYRNSVIRNTASKNLPQNWPVLKSMLVDDQNRLWISTVTDEHNTLRWWVLNSHGKLLARFKWPAEKEIRKIKGGYLYARESNNQGVPVIMRYKISLK